MYDLTQHSASIAATIRTITFYQSGTSPYDDITRGRGHKNHSKLDSNDSDNNDYPIPCQRRHCHWARMTETATPNRLAQNIMSGHSKSRYEIFSYFNGYFFTS